MIPKLVCIAGSRKGDEFNLAETAVMMGRERDNQVCLADAWTSKHHCKIVLTGSHFTLVDLHSRNGTFLNGAPVRERVLEHGDEIRVGRSVFIVLLREDAISPAGTPVQFDRAASWVTRYSKSLELDGPATPRTPSAEGQDAERDSRELEALLRITAVLGSVERLDQLEQKLLETIAEAIPADRGVIIMVGENVEHFTSIFGWDRSPERHHPVEVSRAAIERALRERVAVLRRDAKMLSDADEAKAPQGAEPVRTLLAVPLVVFDRTVGAIYLETGNPEVQLDEGHLEWLKAFGRVAAIALEKARREEWLESENRRLRDELEADRQMVGESRRMQEVYRFITQVAPSAATVLIRGESGTGKELVARAIHRKSPRSAERFVALNCAAITETLLESEMFGHEKGAFTGAVAQKKGKIELADGGTLFLDEIGELSPNLQVKLLRVLQEREFERVGGAQPIKVDIRLLAATNQDLEKAMKEARFRPDLYYRLNVISIVLPPLHERRDDIPLLANYFAAKYCERSNRPVMEISPEARAYLVNYDWPGNVRELANAMERAVVLGTGDVIRPEHLPEDLLGIEIPKMTHFHEVVKETKREVILKAIKQANGSYTEAAKALGLQPTYLHRLVRNLNLKATIRESVSSL
ncbi:MAG TPA: sigma 54-interacting transcriptional regulator [Terriglobia bacterium]|nr:sigma 54-interacting transcriptional regulator [Terriglobia bacterium]